MQLSDRIQVIAEGTGIDVLGFAAASPFENLEHPRRKDPSIALPEARTLILAGRYIGGLSLPSWDQPTIGRTSRLFLSGYFLDMTTPLKPVAAWLRKQGYRALVCDSSSTKGSILPLKLAAVRAGLGWQGKQSLLISHKYGTFLALGGIVTDAHIEPTASLEPDRCGTCSKCQQACPLQALEQPYFLDRGKCLSYILQSDHVSPEARSVMMNRVMDCEICQQVCPFNRKHIAQPLPTAATMAFQSDLTAWEEFFTLAHLSGLTKREYRRKLGPLNTSIPYPIFMRNVRLAQSSAEKIG